MEYVTTRQTKKGELIHRHRVGRKYILIDRVSPAIRHEFPNYICPRCQDLEYVYQFKKTKDRTTEIGRAHV